MTNKCIITFNLNKEEIINDPSKNNCELQMKTFKLFDDSEINDSIEEIKAIPSDFKISFYYLNEVECVFDTFMFACLSGNVPLIVSLLQINDNVKKLNDEYTFGTCDYTTPFTHIIYNIKDIEDKKFIMNLIEKLGGTPNWNKLGSHGELLINFNRNLLLE